ncbi:2,5-diamino-6-(ribosylamino)-4(3H)-pyrimidinone 5'-phosphate reductase [Malassezia sp. CBS 17886]|nr:2,5-diamino-6-(ribosylamino)-4(3H)-pyrimidinone 5'-phosphate reductase [Malassezia sp. CBS 17886]
MSPDAPTRDAIARFLAKHVLAVPGSDRAWATLTFAQSRDGKLAARTGGQLRLSSGDAMYMTHCLRAMHDAILIGAGTLRQDDPQLNCRLLPQGVHCPRPVVLDSALRTPPTCRLLQNFRDGRGCRPLLVATQPKHASHVAEWSRRHSVLEHEGAEIVLVPAPDAEHATWTHVWDALHARGLHSVMVEGGVAVIQSMIHACTQSPHDAPPFDVLLVTECPDTVGEDAFGLGYKVPAARSEPPLPPLVLVDEMGVGSDTLAVLRVEGQGAAQRE